MASAAYTWAVLLHLLSVTFLPFSMLAVGRYDVPAATWIYGANMILLALTALAISAVAERDSGRARSPGGRVELGVLIASAVLSIATSVFAPGSPYSCSNNSQSGGTRPAGPGIALTPPHKPRRPSS